MKENKKKKQGVDFESKIINSIKEILPYIIVILVVILIKAFIVSPIKVNGTSMYSTLHDGDIMILNKITYRFNDIKRFDVVVVDTPLEPIIKRVIGLPGDVIEYKNYKLYVNGNLVEEYFLTDAARKDTCKYSDNYDIDICSNKFTVPEGRYFVLGDNRGNSIDSRYLGFIRKERITGRAKYILFPFNRIKSI